MRKVTMLVCVMVMVFGLVTVDATAKNFDLEIGIVKPIAPDVTLDIGLTGSVKLCTTPSEWNIIGGRDIYADFLYIDGNGMCGVSGSLGGNEGDNARLRFGATFWLESDSEPAWTMYILQPLKVW